MLVANETIEGFIVENEEACEAFGKMLKRSDYRTNETITYPALYIEHVGNMLIKRDLNDLDKLKQCGYVFHRP